MTDRAQVFLRSPAAKSPFLLTLSYLEVHHQNDKDTFDPPKEFAGRYPNPFIPPDLRPLPGTWPSQIADYFACVAKMDEIVGTLRRTLVETGNGQEHHLHVHQRSRQPLPHAQRGVQTESA